MEQADWERMGMIFRETRKSLGIRTLSHLGAEFAGVCGQKTLWTLEHGKLPHVSRRMLDRIWNRLASIAEKRGKKEVLPDWRNLVSSLPQRHRILTARIGPNLIYKRELPLEISGLCGWWLETIQEPNNRVRFSLGEFSIDVNGMIRYDGSCYDQEGAPVLGAGGAPTGWRSFAVEFDPHLRRLFYIYSGNLSECLWDGFGMMQLDPHTWNFRRGYFVDVTFESNERKASLRSVSLLRLEELPPALRLPEDGSSIGNWHGALMKRFADWKVSTLSQTE